MTGTQWWQVRLALRRLLATAQRQLVFLARQELLLGEKWYLIVTIMTTVSGYHVQMMAWPQKISLPVPPHETPNKIEVWRCFYGIFSLCLKNVSDSRLSLKGLVCICYPCFMTPQWLAGRSTAYLQSDAGPTQNASCGEVVMLSWNPIHSEIFYIYFNITIVPMIPISHNKKI